MPDETIEAPTSWIRELTADPVGFVGARPQVILIPLVLVVGLAL